MALLLRAITLPPTEVVAGVERLVRVDTAGLTAWATELPNSEPRFGHTDLLEHHRVVTDIFNRVEACLPARFPSWFDQERVLSRHAQLAAGLERVKGCCELAVTGVWLGGDDVPETVEGVASGRAYLARRQRAYASSDRRVARANQLAGEIGQRLGDAVVEARRKVCPSPTIALSLALLVKRTSLDVEEVRATVGCTADDVRILVNGPWPPYTFADFGSEQGDG